MEFTDIKAPEPVEGIPPWQDPRWVAEAEDWIAAACARAGRARTGPAQGRARSYSGPTLRQARARTGDLGAWHAMLRGYGELQFDLARHVDGLLAIGLADLRPGSVTGQFERLLASPAAQRAVGTPDGITGRQYQALRTFAPRLREWCAELEELGIPASLDHADAHPNNVFAVTGTPFDWGDAAVAHPFCSLLVALRTGAEHAGLPPGAPALATLTDGYVRPWLDAGHRRTVVDRSLSLALRIAPLARG